jgi:hypothetical protein
MIFRQADIQDFECQAFGFWRFEARSQVSKKQRLRAIENIRGGAGAFASVELCRKFR